MPICYVKCIFINKQVDIYSLAKVQLIIYIRNSRDIYALTEWLQNALLKKVNRGLTPSVEYLANCSTMKKIVRMAAKMLSDQDHKTATKQEKEQAAREHAAYIIGCVEYLSKF